MILTDNDAELPLDATKKTGYQEWLSRLKQSYQEGYSRSREKFLEKEEIYEAGSLSQEERLSGALLTLVVVESLTMGVGILGAWLFLGAPAGAVAVQARLFAAIDAATHFRASTRLPRLLAELAALPIVLRAVARRPKEERGAFVADRAKQTVAVLAVVCLTIRAFNSGGLLLGATGPAGAEIFKPISRLALTSPLAAAVSSAAHAAVAGLVALGSQLSALDASARLLLPLRPLFILAELEHYLTKPFFFLCAVAKAFFDEVIMTGLRRLGFLTIQTLG